MGRTLGLIFLLVIAAIVIANLTRPGPKSANIVQITPTAKDLKAAQKAGLSTRFAAQGWSAFIYNERKYVQLAGLNAESPTPADDDLRSFISQLKDLAQTDADKVALQRVRASLWGNHMARQLQSRGKNDPLFQDAAGVADSCYFAMLNSFRDSAKNFGQNCLDSQSKAKAEFDKQGVSNWSDL
ncbi:MAG TPA: hypothetical protein VJW20_24720 [Candidatus Angelobacter sp.]|nr:hypothetical protein [Candidatus Angelobacter sp.]